MDILNIQGTQIDGKDRRKTAVVKTFGEFLKDNYKSKKKTIDSIRDLTQMVTATTDEDLLPVLEDRIKYEKGFLPAFQFSVTDGGGETGILRANNVMQVDIDYKDNPHIANIKEIVKGISWVSYAMHSASGKGVFLIIKIADAKNYKSHFAAFVKYLNGKYDIQVDKGVSFASSLRFWSYDNDPYTNPDALVWDYFEKVETQQKRFKQQIAGNGSLSPFEDFYERGDVQSLLEAYGYSHEYTKGEKVRYTRPGKDRGVSIDWHTSKRTLYVFSSAPETGLQNFASRGISPATTFIELECNGNAKDAYQKLNAMGFGKKPDLKTYRKLEAKQMPLPQRNPIMSPRAQEAPQKRFDTLSRDGETWEVEINEHGYPAMWDS